MKRIFPPLFLFLLLLFLALNTNIRAQESYSVSGKVIDADTREALAFVNIQITGTLSGGTTDIDGKFSLASKKPIESIRLTYVGYNQMTYTIPHGQNQDILIKLSRKAVDLQEVVIYPTENPAHRIIKLVIANRDKNDPEKLPSFSYTSYEKTIFTAQLDTLNLPDSVKNDSSLVEARNFLSKQDIGLMETVVDRKFMAPDKNYENVKASRVSGFKDPIFVFLISQIQSTSFYKDFFKINDKNYINPISKGSIYKYIFLIEDTTYTANHDTVFIISYRPRPNTNFDGLEGVLYINSHGWAIQNVIARPAKEEGFSIKIQQQYALIDSVHWFPVQLNTDVIFNNATLQAGNAKLKLIGIGKSYIRDIELNPENIKKQFALLGVDVDPNATDKNNKYWNKYRLDTLSDRDKRTYAFLDSIGKANNFDKLAKGFETVLDGRIPYKFLDIDLNRIITYNGYEGLYLGLGVHTNEKLSRNFRIGGYGGYGFRDKEFKYGGDFQWIMNRRNEISLNLAYDKNVNESGGVTFFDENKSLLTGENWRALLIKRMNPTESFSGGLGFRVFRDFKAGVELNVNTKDSPDNYRYGISQEGLSVLSKQFRFTDIRAGFRFAFREEFIVTKRARVSLGSKYPVVWLMYTHGIKGLFNSDYDYNRIDLKVEKSFYTKYLGETSLVLKAGYVDRSIPAPNLFNGNGSYRFLSIFAQNSFATMRMNEFLSDRYVALYFTHNFGKLLSFSKKFQPEFVIATNVGFGSLAYTDKHYDLAYKTMEKGYYESGFLLNNLVNLYLYNIGVGFFYRYGPYSLDLPEHNLAIKISVVFPFKMKK